MEICKRISIELPEQKDISNKLFFKVRCPQLGDIVLINAAEHRHVGVMLDKKNMLTVLSTGNRGVHRISLNHPWISQRIIGIYRYAG